MADRNEVFRIILEGRDKLSKELDSVRRASDKLDDSLKRLKRNKPEDFPLFGGGKATRGPGGQFIKKEDISLVDQMRNKVDQLNNSINILKRNRVKEGEFPLFGGGRAIRGDDGRFIRVQDVTLLEKAKNRLDAIDKALVRIRTRVRRGPLVEGEEPGAGASRLVRTAGGQFARAEDLSFIRRLQREFSVLSRSVKDIQSQTRQGLFLGTQNTIADIKKVGAFLDQIKTKFKDGLLGSGKTRTGVDPTTGRFISVADITAFGRFVNLIERGATRITAANKKVSDSQREVAKTLKDSFTAGIGVSRGTEELIRSRVAESRREAAQRKADLAEKHELDKVELSATEDAARESLFRQLEDQREADAVKIEEHRAAIRELGRTEEEEAERSDRKAEIRAIQRARRLRESRERAALGADFQARRANQRLSQASERREIDIPDVRAIEEEAKRVRTEFLATGTAVERFGKRAGLAFGDTVRGVRAARSGLRDMERDTNLVRNSFTRFGFAVGTLFKNFGQLVNLRWLFLTGILSTFFTIIVQLATALTALAASAIQAGAALGGAFLSGLAQALPVVGLLAAAFSRFNTVLDAVKLNEKLGNKAKDNVDNIRNAAQRLSDSQYSLKKAIESVKDAQLAVVDANKDLKNSYKDVKDATTDLAQAKVQAAKDIVDANLDEKDAALSLKEAELGVLEAKQRLREEENKKKTGGQDAEDARAALREAQERLRIANEQKDQSEISGAQQAVTIAEQNLNSILDQVDSSKTDLKDAQLGVQRANLTLEQARVRNNRAAKDARDAREKGVAGSDIVKNAQDQLKSALEGVEKAQRSVVLANRGVRDALHQVAVAQREVADARKDEADAHKNQSQADKDAQKAFADLSPAEKKLFQSLKRLRKVFKDVFVGNSERDGILGPITEAIARFADTLTKLLLDPKIQKAAQNLANSIADALDSFRRFVGSAEFKEALLFFTEKAADNIPRVVEGMLNLAKAFLNIAQAANPIFDRLLKGAVGLTGRLKDATSQKGETRRPEEGAAGRLGAVATINESGLDRFLASAGEHLDDWIKLSGAIIGLIDAIANSAAASTGKTLIEDITTQLDKFAQFIRDNPDKVKKFFDDARESIENLSRVLGRLTEALVKSFSSDEFTAFAATVADVIIPGLLLFIFTLGKLSKALQFLLDIPIVGDIVKWALAILVAEKAFNKVFPVTQKLTDGIKQLAGAMFRIVRERGFKGLFDTITTKAKTAKDAIVGLGKTFTELGKKTAEGAVSGVTKLKQAFLDAAKAAGNMARAIGTAVYTSLANVGKLIVGQVIGALRALTLGIRLLVSATVIGALITAAILIIANWDKVKKYARILADFLLKQFHRVVDWVKDNWKKILIGALAAPFLAGALPFILIYKFRDRIVSVLQGAAKLVIKAFEGIIDWARKNWKLLVAIIVGIFLPGVGISLVVLRFKDRILAAFGSIKDGIIGAFRQAFKFVRDEFTSVIDFLKKQYDKLPGPVKTIIKATAKAASIGGSALGKAQDIGGAILRRAGGGTVPGHGKGDTVPALLTPGEWVLNEAQQKKLTSLIGLSKKGVLDFLFGATGTFSPGGRRAPGMKVEGNIDILHRPQVKNKDGTTSSVRSGTFSTDAGVYVLPTVIGNKIVSDDEAFKYFMRTGQNLGLFDTLKHAEAYSQRLHIQQAQLGKKFENLDTVKRNLKPGQWVLNQGQQARAATSLAISVQQLKARLFGTNSNIDPRTGKREAGFNTKLRTYRDFNLISQTDPDNNVVWFVELANKSFGQVTGRDAKRIQDTDGRWIPGYVKRSAGGFKGALHTVVDGPRPGLGIRHWIKRTPTRKATEAFIRNNRTQKFSMGGVVAPGAVQRFAEGGIVQAPGFGGVERGGENKTINQNFTVKTQGETDWGYVMRLASINAQESF